MNFKSPRHLRALPDSRSAAHRSHRFKPARRTWGSAEPEPIPDFVREEMSQAAELWQSLQDDGKRLQYEIDELTGRVIAELRDLDGTLRGPVALTQALGAADDYFPAA